MRNRSQVVTAVVAVTAASTLLASGVASASTAGPAAGARAVLASTAPTAGQYGSSLAALAPASQVQVSVFVGRDQAALAALATAVSNPASRSYGHYLTPAQVRARYGATAAQQHAVASWLRQSGLHVTYSNAFTVSASGSTAQAESALRARLELSRPRDAIAQVVSAGPMSVPAALGRTVSTVRVATAAIPMGQHEPLKKMSAVAPGSKAAKKIKEECSGYYGQKKASALPGAYGYTLGLGALRLPAAAASLRLRRHEVRADRQGREPGHPQRGQRLHRAVRRQQVGQGARLPAVQARPVLRRHRLARAQRHRRR